MTFARPVVLWLLLILLPLAYWVARGLRKQAREWRDYGRSGSPRRQGAWTWLITIALLIVAAAGPRWGRLWGESESRGHDVVLVIDVSRSMAVEDAVPSRLGVAIESATSLVRALAQNEGARVGLIGFAGRAALKSPLTESLGGVVDALHELKPASIKPGGTDLGVALDAAREAFDEQPHPEGRTVVLFSDGEDLAGSWRDQLAALRDAHVIVHTIAIGDPKSAHPVPGPGRSGGALIYDGKPVASRRNDAPLSAIARETGGAFIPLGLATADLGSLYRQKIEPVAKASRSRWEPSAHPDRSMIFVVAGSTIGLVGSWPARKRRSRTRRRTWFAKPALVGLAIGAFALQGARSNDPTIAHDSLATLISKGNTLYSQGTYLPALDAFDRAIGLDPKAAVPRYNAAATLYQLDKYTEAIARYHQARGRAARNPLLQLKIDFALGNTLLIAGDIAGAVASYDACLANKLAGTAASRIRGDAAINRNFALNLPKPNKPKDPQTDSEPNQDDAQRNRDRPPPGRNETGGGGSDPPPPGQGRANGGRGGGGTNPNRGELDPNSRLDSALQRIRDARGRRLQDDSSEQTERDRKDW